MEDILTYDFHLAGEKREEPVRSWLLALSGVCFPSSLTPSGLSLSLCPQVPCQGSTQSKLSLDGDSHYTKRSLSKGKTLRGFRNQILSGSLMKATVFPPEKFMSSLNTKRYIKGFRNFTSFLKLKGI